jgi:MIP family channel proteins
LGRRKLSKIIQNIITEFNNISVWRQCLAEFFATGLFVFIGAGAVASSGIASSGELDTGRLVVIALAHGLAICLLAYSVGHISGAHLNPAITIAAIINGKIGWIRGQIYISGQIAGGIVAALILMAVIPDVNEGNLGAHGLGEGVSVGMGFTIELIFTFLLSFVVFATAMDKRSHGAMAPVAIGITVAVVHLVAVPLTGAGINPARSLGPAIVSGFWTDHWIYWVAPILGAILGGTLYQFIFAKEIESN